MTDRDGDVVQHYGYYAFGKERYKNNTQAFAVTNRYTGQQIDEDTGLYYYNARYYDPELSRFVQADTIVPSANTSQALNRYAYVRNNPLKFTDPSGHGWLSKAWKKIKGFLGTIITIGLTLAGVPLPIASLIGSAIGTAVNSGTFKSFAIGVGIGIAAGCIANAIGGYFAGGSDAWKAFVNKDWIGGAISGALQGTAAGAVGSAIYGGNTGQAMLEGAAMGAGTGALMSPIAKKQGTLKNTSFGKIGELVNNTVKFIADTAVKVATVAIDIALTVANTTVAVLSKPVLIAAAIAVDAIYGPLDQLALDGTKMGIGEDVIVKAFRLHDELQVSYVPNGKEIHTSLDSLNDLRAGGKQWHFCHELGHIVHARNRGVFYYATDVLFTTPATILDQIGIGAGNTIFHTFENQATRDGVMPIIK
jgi:RHS repeat-associated protein